MVRVMLCDSSPQVHFDWLWSQFLEIPRDRLVPVYTAILQLARDVQAYASGETDEALKAKVDPEEAWRGNLKEIGESLRLHICPPTALASGHTSAVHKARALLHQWYLESPPAMPL
eukprot:5138887-Lingulodinium_polyedra.AAC.1